jgi:hypothetical protein
VRDALCSTFDSWRMECHDDLRSAGRILRPKPRGSSRFNAFFYTLVSRGAPAAAGPRGCMVITAH